MARTRRIRRTAEEARTAALDAAERRLREVGPAGIRLQDIAAEVGISHPTLLHHFGSREALVQAVVARCFDSLDADVLSAIASVPPSERAVEALLDRVFETLAAGGHARTLAWLALAEFPAPPHVGRLDAVIAAVHARRSERRKTAGKAPPPLEDSRHGVLLATFALFGEAVLGPMLFERAGSGPPGRGGARFRSWLGRLLLAHLDAG